MYKILPILLFAFLLAEEKSAPLIIQSDSLDFIWAEEQLERTQRPQPAHCALWGNICQRIGADQIADPFLRALAFYEKALDGYRSAQEMEGLAIVHNNMGLAYMGLAQNDADNYRSAIPLLEKAARSKG